MSRRQQPYSTFMFSEKRGLACLDQGDNIYYVCNGDWFGRREGDTFWMQVPHMNEEVPVTVDDWVEKDLMNLNHDERMSWYLPYGMNVWEQFHDLFEQEMYDFEDEIPF